MPSSPDPQAPMTPGDMTTANAANASPTTAAVAAADALLAALSDAQLAAVSFAFDDAAQRARWSNFPTVAFPRAGLRLGDLLPGQRAAIMAVLAATLSAAGYRQVLDIMDADELLRPAEAIFGRDEYWFALLGTPSTSGPWRWQFGGHHLGLNATFASGDVTLAPSLTGAQPATFTRDGVPVRPLGAEHDAAYTLISLLDADQRRRAIIAARHIDLVLGPGQDGRTIAPEGLSATAMTTDQREALLALIRARVGLVHDTAAARRMAAIRDDLDRTSFAWAGPTGDGSAAYWRIQGPTVVIEYAPQWFRSGEPDADHIHAIYRDPTNDYGSTWAH